MRQEEKSQEARRRIAEAAIDCLVELGYHGSSTTRIVERSGMSRGAMQHHFPSKQDLIVGATDILLEGVIRRSEPLLADLEARRIGFPELVERLWKHFIGSRRYQAVLELMNASRTDPELQSRITPTLDRWNRIIDERMARLFSSVSGDPSEVALLMQMTRALLRGLALRDGGPLPPAMVRRMLERWAQLVEPCLSWPAEKENPCRS
jgi:AcrR family transcriptional regulator